MSLPFDAGRVRGQDLALSDEPGLKSPAELAETYSTELDLLYTPGQKETEQLQISRDYHWGILQVLKDSR